MEIAYYAELVGILNQINLEHALDILIYEDCYNVKMCSDLPNSIYIYI